MTPGMLPQVLAGTRVDVVPQSADAKEPVLASRNFDPETRTLRKRQANEEIDDTLEQNVKGLAEQIIADLVTAIFHSNVSPFQHTHAGSPEYCTKTAKLGSQKRTGEEGGEIGEADPAGHSYADSYVRCLSLIFCASSHVF
jgi:hypothetical protein